MNTSHLTYKLLVTICLIVLTTSIITLLIEAYAITLVSILILIVLNISFLFIKKTNSYQSNNSVDYELMMQNLDEGVMFVDNDEICIKVNKRWVEITGYDKEELVGKDIKKLLLHPEDIAFMAEQVEQRRSNISNRYEIRILTKSKEEKWVLIIGSPLSNNEGEIIGSIGIMTDITQAKIKDKQLLDYAKDLESSLHQLKRANEDLDQFASVVSHDLRSPLNTISNFSTLLERQAIDHLDNCAKEYLQFIQGASMNMHAIIEGLLHMARFGPSSMNKEDVALNEVIEMSLLNLNSEIEKEEAIINYYDLHTVHCDKIHLQQLFQNLIENALKYHQIQQKPEINIWTQEIANGIEVCIQDNGIGINPEYQEKIFQVFNQLDNKTEGIGLGLATCKKIVDNHNGKIKVESEEGKGCLFRVYLPNGIT